MKEENRQLNITLEDYLDTVNACFSKFTEVMTYDNGTIHFYEGASVDEEVYNDEIKFSKADLKFIATYIINSDRYRTNKYFYNDKALELVLKKDGNVTEEEILSCMSKKEYTEMINEMKDDILLKLMLLDDVVEARKEHYADTYAKKSIQEDIDACSKLINLFSNKTDEVSVINLKRTVMHKDKLENDEDLYDERRNDILEVMLYDKEDYAYDPNKEVCLSFEEALIDKINSDIENNNFSFNLDAAFNLLTRDKEIDEFSISDSSIFNTGYDLYEMVDKNKKYINNNGTLYTKEDCFNFIVGKVDELMFGKKFEGGEKVM